MENDTDGLTFQELYRSVYNICLDGDKIEDFTNDLKILLSKNLEKLDNDKIKCLNDILIFYRKSTGYRIAKYLEI